MNFDFIYKMCMIISSVFEIYLVINFYQAFHAYREKFESSCKRYCLFILFVCVNVAINFQNNSFLNLLLIPVLYLVILMILFMGNFASYLVHWVMATVVIFGSEFVFLILLGIPMDVSTDKLFDEPFLMLSSIFAVKFVSFILFLILKQMSVYSTERFSTKIFGNYIIVPVATVGIMWAIPYVREINETITKGDIILVLFYILMLVGNIRLFYMFIQYNEIKKRELEKEVALTKYQAKEWHFKEMEQSEKRYMVLVHNIKHYLRQIGRFAEQGKDEEIIKTVKDLQVDFLESENKEICTHNLLNSILLDWKERAEKQNIKPEIFVEAGFQIDYMRGIDIMAVFGNLLDNALEAASQCKEGKVRIQMYMQNGGAFSVIHIKNNYTGTLKYKGKVLVSTKKDGEIHGIGIESVKEIIGHYRGWIENSGSNQQYETTIMIPAVVKEK